MDILNFARRSPSATNILLGFIALMALIVFMQMAKVILLPVVISFFLTGLLSAPSQYFVRRQWPVLPAMLLSLTGLSVVIGLLGLMVLISLQDLGTALPQYANQLVHLADQINALALERGVNLKLGQFVRELNLTSFSPMLMGSFEFIYDIGQYAVLIFFITLFMLMEQLQIRT